MQNQMQWQPDSYPEGGEGRKAGHHQQQPHHHQVRGSLGQFIERSTSAPPATAMADPTDDSLVGNVSTRCFSMCDKVKR